MRVNIYDLMQVMWNQLYNRGKLKHLPADPKANFHACDVTVVTAYFLVSAMNMLGMRA